MKNLTVALLCLLLASCAFAVERVVSLSPALTDTVIFCSSQEKLVGITSYCTPVKGAQRVGGIVNPSLERILSLRPDLVVASTLTSFHIIKRLKERNIKVLTFRLLSLEDIKTTIQTIGYALGKDGKMCRKLFERQIGKEIKRLTPCLKGKKVVIIFSTKPLYCAGKGSYLGEILSLAGAKVVPDRAYTPISPEFLISEKPSLVVIAEEGNRQPEFCGSFRTVRLKPELLLHPGPAVIEGLKAMEEKLCR